MNKSRHNKNDRKRQYRKDFSHGRDRQTPSQDQRSPYPKSHITLRAQLAGATLIYSGNPSHAITPIPVPGPSLSAAEIMLAMQDMQDAMITQAFLSHGIPILSRIDHAAPPRLDLKREMKVGEILAYRCWRLIGNQLRSVYMYDNWNPGEIMHGRDIEDWSERGIHAWKDLNSTKFNEYVRRYLSVERDPWRMLRHEAEQSTIIVTGTVHLWGDVVEHEHGYRAEYAKIVSLDWLYPDAVLMGREQETLMGLRKLYGVT